jgi:hypothetical protein
VSPSCSGCRSAARPVSLKLLELVPRFDRREADQRDGVLGGDLAVVELAEEPGELLGVTQLGVVVLDLVRRELAERAPQSTATIIPFWYLRDLSPSRIVAVLRCDRSCASTIGE